MDGRRWSNTCRARSSYSARASRVDGGPLEAFLEISARCNLRCRMCAIGFDTRYRPRSGRPALFAPDLFARLRPIFPTLLRAHLYGLGEPVLNPHLADYVRELSAAGVEVWFTTNGTLIDAERAEAFAAAGADRISISVDGAKAETYEAIRRGAKFADLTRGLEALGAARRRHGRPRLSVNFVAMKRNVRELPRMVDLCSAIGVEELHVEPLFYWGGESPDLDRHYGREALDDERYQAIMEDTRCRAGDAGIHFSTRFLASDGPMDYRERVQGCSDEDWICSEPWATVYVTAAGEVRTCCLNDTSFGNLFEQPFAEIWNGEAFRRFRGQHRARARAPAGCGACLENGRKRHSPYFEAVEPVSYRPRPRASPAAAGGGCVLDRPGDGEIVTDPLVVTGRLPAADGALDRGAAPQLYIDRTWVASLASAIVDGERFLLVLPVPYLTEGAHVLALGWGPEGEAGPPAPGRGERTIHFWRAPKRDPDALAAVDTAAAVVMSARLPEQALLRVDGRPWPAFAWYCGRRSFELRVPGTEDLGIARRLLRRLRGHRFSTRVWLAGAVLDVTALPAGCHALEIRAGDGAARSFALERFSG